MPIGGQYSWSRYTQHRRSLWFCPGPKGRVRWTSVRVDCVAKPIEPPAYFAALHNPKVALFRTCRDVRVESVKRSKADVINLKAASPALALGVRHPQQLAVEGHHHQGGCYAAPPQAHPTTSAEYEERRSEPATLVILQLGSSFAMPRQLLRQTQM